MVWTSLNVLGPHTAAILDENQKEKEKILIKIEIGQWVGKILQTV